MGLIDPDKRVKYGGHGTNRSREIPTEAVGGGIFDGFFSRTFRPEVTSDIISSADVDQVGNGCPLKIL